MSFQLDGVLRWHLRIFQLFGYFPFALRARVATAPQAKLQRHERCLQAWSCLLLCTFSVITLVALNVDDEFLFTGDLFGYFNDGLKILMGQMAVSIIYVETLQQRAAQWQFWWIYQRLHDKRTQVDAGDGAGAGAGGFRNWWRRLWQQLRQHRHFLCCFYGLFVGELIAMALFALFQRPMLRHLVLFWGVFEPFIVCVRMRLLQCLLHVELLRQELSALAADVRLLSEFTAYACQRRCLPFLRYGDYVRQVLWQQQLRYARVYELYACMQEALGRSMLAALVMIYVRVIVDTYFSYYTYYRSWLGMENFLLFMSYTEIPIFLIASKNCMRTINELTYRLHTIQTQLPGEVAADSGFSKQLQNFSLQILHQRLRIDGLGITPLDGYMLTKAIGSLITYMIFFIQFMPKFVRVPKQS